MMISYYYSVNLFLNSTIVSSVSVVNIYSICLSIYSLHLNRTIDDDTYGQTFHSKHYPDLQYFVHSGFDGERGMFLSVDFIVISRYISLDS